MSVPQENSTVTTELPVADSDRTRVTWGAPFRRLSRGKEMSLSTSSAAIPALSVTMVTTGGLRSG
jgi:hypothetical protein